MSRYHGGRIVARALKREGITHLFTLCGGHVQAIYDGCIEEQIGVVDVRHEQSAAHAADGHARVTGTPGVAVVTAGPGVTGTVTAVANALRAEVPMVVLGGQGARVHGPFGGQDRGALQEMNHVELMRSITKWSVSVPETRRLGEYVQSAFRIAASGVPGPVFLELPLDILMGLATEDELTEYPDHRTLATAAGDPEYIERAAALLRAAERPLLILGSQWRWTRRPAALEQLLQRYPMPTFLSGMARGALPAGHRCGFRRCRSRVMPRADCVLVVGTPLDFRLGYGEKIPVDAHLILVDLDGARIGLNRGVEVGIVGDAGHVLQQLAGALEARPSSDRERWLDHVSTTETELVQRSAVEARSSAEPINPLRLCHEVNRFVDERTIVVGDGGDFVATAAAFLDVQGPGSWMDPGPLGTLGVGPGYAMAAKLARPDHRVILMLGDGSFGFNAMEYDTMVRHGINVVGIVGNDAAWTQIRRGQVAIYGEQRAVATSLAHTRYDLVVQALGGQGEHVQRVDQLAPALDRAFSCARPALVNVEIGTSDFRKHALAV